MPDYIDNMELLDWEDENIGEDTPFVIDTDGKADWAMRKIREAEKECERMNAVRRERIDVLNRAIDRENARLADKTRYLRNLLETYFESIQKKETKTQYSYALPCGKLVQKKPQPKPEHDDAEIIRFLESTPAYRGLGLTETKTTLKWGETRKLLTFDGDHAVFKDTGEIVPGVTVNYSDPEFIIKVEDE